MTNTIELADDEPVSLRAEADSVKLDATVSLTIEGVRLPQLGDDIEILFLGGASSRVVVVYLNRYDFPVIEFLGERYVLVPAGRTDELPSSSQSLVTRYWSLGPSE